MPALAPGAEATRLLRRMPLARLRSEAEKREINVPARATRQQIASLLVWHTRRQRSEQQYREQGIAFEPRDSAYPHIRRLLTRQRLRRILDVGCGPGLFAEELRRTGALPPDGSYVGFDLSPSAVELAQKRFANDPRFAFHVGDAESFGERPGMDVDGIVISFVLSYLDTHAVHRLLGALAAQHPKAVLIAALTFRSCVDRVEGLEPDEARELRAARRYLAGDTSAAEGLWDLRRLLCYRQSLETYYETLDERALRPLAQMLWVGRPSCNKRTARGAQSRPRRGARGRSKR